MFLEHVTISQTIQHCDMHKHDLWEICYNISGFGKSYIEQEETGFYPGSIYVCPPLCEHGKVAEKEPFQDIFMAVSDSGILSRLKNRHFSDNVGSSVKTLMFMLYDIYHTRPAGYRSVVDSLTETICNMLILFDGSVEFSPDVEIIKNEIIKNFINPEFKVEYAIKSTNYNADYMRRCFKKETGMNPLTYLNTLRIENAKKLLRQKNRTPKYTIGEIATMSGFYDIHYFSRAFKKATGVSPSEMQASI